MIVVELVVILVLVIVNGVFSMSEMAVVAAKRIRLEHRAEQGDRGAAAALRLAEHPTQFLSTVQVGITLVGVLTGAFGGATVAEIMATEMETLPWIGAYSESVALAIVVLGITYLTLIVGELVPKRIALSNPERVAAFIARPMTQVSRIGRPFVAFLSASTNFVFGLLRLGRSPEPGLTEEEIHAVIEQGAESGVVPLVEHEIVESVFRLGDHSVASIMTPRTSIEWVDVLADEKEIRADLARARRQWVLVCEESVERIVGVAHAGDLLSAVLEGRALDLRVLATAPLFVPESTPVFRLLGQFRDSRTHVAIVLDEFGGVDGLVTLDDIVDELVGVIPRGAEPDVAPPIVRTGPGEWIAQGIAPLDEACEALDIVAGRNDQSETERGYRTVGGLILAHLGRIPTTEDAVEWNGFRWTVELMNGRRVERVRISRADNGAPSSTNKPPASDS